MAVPTTMLGRISAFVAILKNMVVPKKAAARGRPPLITRERIADAGIQMSLPKLSFVGVAGLLGVSHIALYKHVANLAALRELVAEAIFERWQLPALLPAAKHSIEDDLRAFHRSLRAMVDQNPGLAPFLTLHGKKTTQMIAHIRQHHVEFQRVHGLTLPQTAWLLSTVAFHCIALADTVYSRQQSDGIERSPIEQQKMDASYERSMEALIKGALMMCRDETC